MKSPRTHVGSVGACTHGFLTGGSTTAVLDGCKHHTLPFVRSFAAWISIAVALSLVVVLAPDAAAEPRGNYATARPEGCGALLTNIYIKEGKRTYAAYNFNDKLLTVKFSDGTRVLAAPRSMTVEPASP